ncbi:DUF4804 domain-containing protein [bacterium]|nr:MAG: DUF4804 domain-containing protein [bacterium]QQR61819.1 MAG: DUF4804 domain-containing protein [bacterium]QQR62598.1 MAG: DUF4804 domain-containing protein [bacterium]
MKKYILHLIMILFWSSVIEPMEREEEQENKQIEISIVAYHSKRSIDEQDNEAKQLLQLHDGTVYSLRNKKQAFQPLDQNSSGKSLFDEKNGSFRTQMNDFSNMTIPFQEGNQDYALVVSDNKLEKNKALIRKIIDEDADDPYSILHNTEIISARILNAKDERPILVTGSQWPSIKITYKKNNQWKTESFLDNCFLLGADANGMVIAKINEKNNFAFWVQRRLNKMFAKELNDDLVCRVTLYAVFFDDLNTVNKKTGKVIEKIIEELENNISENRVRYNDKANITISRLSLNVSFTKNELENYQNYFPKVGITKNSAVVIHTQDYAELLQDKKNRLNLSYESPAFSFSYKKEGNNWIVNRTQTEDIFKNDATSFESIKNIHMINSAECIVALQNDIKKISINKDSGQATLISASIGNLPKKANIITTVFSKQNNTLHVLLDGDGSSRAKTEEATVKIEKDETQHLADFKYSEEINTIFQKTSAFQEKFTAIKMQDNNTIKTFFEKIDKNEKGTVQNEIVSFAQDAKIFVDDNILDLISEILTFKVLAGSKKEREYYKKFLSNPNELSLIDEDTYRKDGYKLRGDTTATFQTKLFLQSLMKKKYFTFFNTREENGTFIVNNGIALEGNFKNFQAWKEVQIKKESEGDFDIENVLTLDEMKIASLISTMSQTHFINNGRRQNNARLELETLRLNKGYVAAQVGCCFETENWLEWQDILITKAQNTKENGYGLVSEISVQVKTHQIWEQFYSDINKVKWNDKLMFDEVNSVIKKFQTYHKETKIDQIQYVKLTASEENPIYFYIDAYKARMKAVLVPFLKMAEQIGTKEKKDIALYVTGLGLGVWSELPEPYKEMQTIRILPSALQQEFQTYFDVTVNDNINLLQYLCAYLQIKIYEAYFKNNKNTRIKELYFAWFLNNKDSTSTVLKLNSDANLKNEINVEKDGRIKELTKWNKTHVFWTTLPPASSYFEKENRINVSNFAWDGATHVGNEYWLGEKYLSQSADPAAVACSHIGTYQNPWINEKLLENIEFVE